MSPEGATRAAPSWVRRVSLSSHHELTIHRRLFLLPKVVWQASLDGCHPVGLPLRVKVDLSLVVYVHDGVVPKDTRPVEIRQFARAADDPPRARPIGHVSR